MKKVLVIISAAVVMTACTDIRAALNREEQPVETSPLFVDVQIIDSLTAHSMHTYVGEVEDTESLSVSALAGGKITEVRVKNNDRVKAGDVLFRIDDTQQRNSLASVRATLRQAEDGYKRVKTLYDNGGVPEIKLVEVRTQLQQARSLVQIAEKELQNTVVKAPQDGIVSEMNLRVGQTVAPAAPLCKLLNMQGLSVVFDIPEADIDRVQVGDSGTINVTALHGCCLNGTVAEISLVANRLAHTYKVKMAIIETTSSPRLLPGMVCKVQLRTDEQKGYLIPANCIQTRQDGLTVWVATALGDERVPSSPTTNRGSAYRSSTLTAHRRTVETAGYVGDKVLVSSGLQQGDIVITSGYQKLYINAPVVF